MVWVVAVGATEVADVRQFPGGNRKQALVRTSGEELFFHIAAGASGGSVGWLSMLGPIRCRAYLKQRKSLLEEGRYLVAGSRAMSLLCVGQEILRIIAFQHLSHEHGGILFQKAEAVLGEAVRRE